MATVQPLSPRVLHLGPPQSARKQLSYYWQERAKARSDEQQCYGLSIQRVADIILELGKSDMYSNVLTTMIQKPPIFFDTRRAKRKPYPNL